MKEEGGQVVLVFWQLLQQLDCLNFFFSSLFSFLISDFPPLRIYSSLGLVCEKCSGARCPRLSLSLSLSLTHTHTHAFHSCYLLLQ